MLRQLISKWGIMSIDLQNAVDKDMAVIMDDGNAEYVENISQSNTDDTDTVIEQEYKEVSDATPHESANAKSLESAFFDN
jgi:recombination protein RecT